jgi:hypothetical protein
MNALFVAGTRHQTQVKLGTIDNRDVAPPLAHLLGRKRRRRRQGADGDSRIDSGRRQTPPPPRLLHIPPHGLAGFAPVC